MQNDLLALGVKSEGEEAYNIHEIPMIDGEKEGDREGELRILEWTLIPVSLSPHAGNPVLVEVSVSLRNILEIDEHKQVREMMDCATDKRRPLSKA